MNRPLLLTPAVTAPLPAAGLETIEAEAAFVLEVGGGRVAGVWAFTDVIVGAKGAPGWVYIDRKGREVLPRRNTPLALQHP